MNRRYLLVMLAVCLIIGCVQAWGADFSAWDYRKEITMNNTGSNLTNYQVLFTVNRSAGSDSGTTVYLDGKCAEDYDDIRFVAADDITLYSYWIENSNSTIASVWVNFTSLPTGDTIAYLYYGNSGASAVSDGDATFPFFDHFDGDALDTDKWTVDSGTPLVSGSVLNLSGSITQKISGKTSFGYNYRFEIRGYHPSNNQAVFGFWSSSEHRTMWLGRAANTNDYVQTRDGPTYTLTDDGIDRSGTTYYIYGGVTRSGASDFYIDRVFRRTLTTHIPTDDMPIALTCEANKGTVCVDWVLVRKYFATEPTVSAWESEEEVPPYWIIADFTGTPTSGNLPLTVYFTSSSTANNCTIDTWQWSFGDSTPNSTQQNPAHTYTTSGLYNVILTVTNTSFSKTNTTQKTAYINVTVNPDAPNADFTVTETCGETSDTFYFIDFSTGGGLYAWNWSFGDGAYSELRNPTHQYAGNGTYDVNLTVWGAYGMDSLLRSNLITIPCGAPTPTPTGTPTGNVTPTGTPGNVTEGNITYIYAPDQDYVPFPIWLAIVIVSIALFGHSIIFLRNSDLTAMMAAVFAFVSAWLSNMIGYIDVQVTYIAEEILISPVIQAVHPPWLVYTMLLFALVSVVNIFAAIYKVYLKPTPWNEIYNRKLPKWRNR